MALTSIEWTGTRLARELVIPHDVRLDEDRVLVAGTHPAGEVVSGFTFNPWLGCEKVSRACKRCYAEARVTGRMGYNPTSGDPRRRLKVWGPPATSTRKRTSRENWQRPHLWNKMAARLGVRFKVFSASLADVGEDNPLVRPWREELFELIDATPWLDWLLLTKRPHVLAHEWPFAWRASPPRNVWAGATVEDAACAAERIPLLLTIPARVRWLSCEPLCGPLDLTDWLYEPMRCRACGSWRVYYDPNPNDLPVIGTCLMGAPQTGEPGAERCGDCGSLDIDMPGALKWVVVGGESGPGHETLNLAHAEALAAQCTEAAVPVFVKQDSGAQPGRRGRLSDALWSQKNWPEVSR